MFVNAEIVEWNTSVKHLFVPIKEMHSMMLPFVMDHQQSPQLLGMPLHMVTLFSLLSVSGVPGFSPSEDSLKPCWVESAPTLSQSTSNAQLQVSDPVILMFAHLVFFGILTPDGLFWRMLKTFALWF